jgi:hypothetical protein
MAKRYGSKLKYQIYRSQARRLAAESALIDPILRQNRVLPENLRFEPIDLLAIQASVNWGDTAHDYPWESVPKWKEKDCKGFDLAIWHRAELWGLCYATPRKSLMTIKIVLLEGKPGRATAQRGIIAPLALGAVLNYGLMLDCKNMEVQDPDEGAVATYKKLGFRFDSALRLVRPLLDE